MPRDTTDMVEIPAGMFLMGADDPDARPDEGESPVREVAVDGFSIDRTTVTNAQFANFVDATGYRTQAESVGWSYVFKGLLTKGKQCQLQGTRDVKAAPWWLAVDGACWSKPEGPGSSLKGRRHHPVVHVSWHDAAAYCAWADKRLPTEAEWEYAARGGLVGKRFPWGDTLMRGGRHRCNIWQGTFPDVNTLEDGYLGTAPAKSFPPNGFGLYNMSGNVWEWCADWFDRSNGEEKLLKGGSYLCHDSYCNRYRVAARIANDPASASGHAGFRCIAS